MRTGPANGPSRRFVPGSGLVFGIEDDDRPSDEGEHPGHEADIGVWPGGLSLRGEGGFSRRGRRRTGLGVPELEVDQDFADHGGVVDEGNKMSIMEERHEP